MVTRPSSSSTQPDEPLLAVTYAHALQWFKDMREREEQPLRLGAFNREATTINAELQDVLNHPTPLHNKRKMDGESEFLPGPSADEISAKQRCRTCGEPIGKAGHPRGKCPKGPAEKPVDDRKQRAQERIEKLGIQVPDKMQKGQKRCPLCRLPRAGDHLVRNRIEFCPYADSVSVKRKFEDERNEKKKQSK
ncbi:hypothetical protein FOL47_003671, partial [Perkinsus chesapeaki]